MSTALTPCRRDRTRCATDAAPKTWVGTHGVRRVPIAPCCGQLLHSHKHPAVLPVYTGYRHLHLQSSTTWCSPEPCHMRPAQGRTRAISSKRVAMLLCLHMICSHSRVMLPVRGAGVLQPLQFTITLAQGAGESTPVPSLVTAHCKPTRYWVCSAKAIHGWTC